jgi:hypothetical protein
LADAICRLLFEEVGDVPVREAKRGVELRFVALAVAEADTLIDLTDDDEVELSSALFVPMTCDSKGERKAPGSPSVRAPQRASPRGASDLDFPFT